MRRDETLAAAYEMAERLRKTHGGDTDPREPAIRSRWIEMELLYRDVPVDHGSEAPSDPFASRFDAVKRVHIIGDMEDEPGLKYSLAKTLAEVILSQSIQQVLQTQSAKPKKRAQQSLFPHDPLLLIPGSEIEFITSSHSSVPDLYATGLICPPAEIAARFRGQIQTCERLVRMSPNSQIDEVFLEAIINDIVEDYVVPRACASCVAEYIVRGLAIR